MSEPRAWVVTWKRKGFAVPFLVDFDSEAGAVRCAIVLNESGRYDVAVTTLEDPALDEETKARVAARIAAALAASRERGE